MRMKKSLSIVGSALVLAACAGEPPVQRSGLGSGCVGKSNNSPACQAGPAVQTSGDQDTKSQPLKAQQKPVKSFAGNEEGRPLPDEQVEQEPPPSQNNPNNGNNNNSQNNGFWTIFQPAIEKGIEGIFSSSGSGSGASQGQPSEPEIERPAPTVQQSAPTVQQSAPTVQQSAPTVQQSAPTVQRPVSITLRNNHTNVSYIKASATVDVTAALAAGRTPATQYCSISSSATFTVGCIEGLSNAAYYKVTGPSVAGCPSTGWLYKSHFQITAGGTSSSCP
jgi:hypothetical protein